MLSSPATHLKLEALSCPRCGGAPDPEGGPGHLARCRSCGVLGIIEDPEGRNRLALLPAIDEAFAASALEARLRETNATARFHLHECERLFVPYWRVRSLLTAAVRGRQRRVERVLEKVQLENGQSYFDWTERDDGEEEVRKEVQRSVLTIVSGCPLQEYGLPHLDQRRQIPGELGIKKELDRLGKVVVFHPALRKEGTVLDPLLRRDQAEEEAEGLLEAQAEGLTAGLLPGAEVDLAVIARDTVLLFYPVLLMRFQLGTMRGRAVIDAATGKVVSLRLPRDGSPGLHDRRLVTAVALATSFLAASLARIALLPPPLLQSDDASGFRIRLLIVAAFLVVGGWGGTKALIRYLKRSSP